MNKRIKNDKVKKIKLTKEQQSKMLDFFLKTSIPKMIELPRENK